MCCNFDFSFRFWYNLHCMCFSSTQHFFIYSILLWIKLLHKTESVAPGWFPSFGEFILPFFFGVLYLVPYRVPSEIDLKVQSSVNPPPVCCQWPPEDEVQEHGRDLPCVVCFGREDRDMRHWGRAQFKILLVQRACEDHMLTQVWVK